MSPSPRPDPRHIHFVAIAGTGMGSLAGLLKVRGHHVTGSDEGVYPPMSTALAEWGIPVAIGFDAANLGDPPPDRVVIGNAVRPDNPEARAVLEAGIPHVSFPDALYEYAIDGRHSVVVTGTHGKTTTVSLVATLLLETGRDPSVLVGGIAANLDGSFRDGGGDHFVVEGDEYDTAFFDKTPKFLHYHPQTLIITSVEFDHADIYRDLDHVKSVFRSLVEAMPADGVIVAALEEPNVADVVRDAPCRVEGYAVAGDDDGPASHRAGNLDSRPDGTAFVWERDGTILARPFLPGHGRHNVANALAALVCLEALGVPPETAAAALSSWGGVKRRQEVRGEAHGVTVIDDFAHHPTAVRETLRALRTRYPDRRLIAVFEPRSNTSRRRLFQEAYVEALATADGVVVARVPDTPIYSATGPVTERLSAEKLAADLASRGSAAVACDDVAAIVEHLARHHEPGDVVVTLSNGGFDGIWERLLERLEADAESKPV